MRDLPRLGPCGCRRGIERDNCPSCEGSGQAIDWRKFHADRLAEQQHEQERAERQLDHRKSPDGFGRGQ